MMATVGGESASHSLVLEAPSLAMEAPSLALEGFALPGRPSATPSDVRETQMTPMSGVMGHGEAATEEGEGKVDEADDVWPVPLPPADGGDRRAWVARLPMAQKLALLQAAVRYRDRRRGEASVFLHVLIRQAASMTVRVRARS